MADSERRRGVGLSAVFPEKRLTIQTDRASRQIAVSPFSQFVLVATGLVLLGWLAVSTATVVGGAIAPRADAEAEPLRAAYQDRLDSLAAERDQRAHEAASTQGRFQIAMDQISAQQSQILAAESEKCELSAALDAMRDRLRDAVAARDAASEDSATLRAAEASSAPAGELEDTIRALSSQLSTTAGDRDAAQAESKALGRQVAQMKLGATIAAKRQDQMIDRVEQAVAMSFGPLSQAMSRVDIDVDALLATVRSNYSGEGGPLPGEEGALAPTISTRNYDAGIDNGRIDSMMLDLDRLNLLRVAAGKVPLAIPVKDAFRFSSGFGVRRDPKGAGRRMHAGIDFAAPMGTPIFATADGVVTFAGRQSGYGNVVRIRHDLGFETLYAHQSKIRVKVGQRVSRGDRIGDMGTTGRSTGVHLHYEVRVNGTAVNPLPYVEAARDVQ